MTGLAYKIVSRGDWTAIRASGGYDGSAVDLRDGYIHLSAQDQLAGTAAKHYAGRDDLVLLDVDLTVYGAAIVWEPSRGGALFPHLYDRLTTDSVRAARALTVTAEGEMRIGAAA